MVRDEIKIKVLSRNWTFKEISNLKNTVDSLSEEIYNESKLIERFELIRDVKINEGFVGFAFEDTFREAVKIKLKGEIAEVITEMLGEATINFGGNTNEVSEGSLGEESIKNAPQMKRKIVRTKSEYVDFVKSQNNRTNVYTSVYDFAEFAETAKIESSVILDRVFLDFDAHEENLEQALDDLKIVVDFVNENDYQYTMFFSGKGFHMFVFGEETDDIRNIQEFHRQIKSLLPKNSTLDDRVGQATRLRRVPNTVNLSSSDENGIPYYCIPIFENDLKSGLQKIKTLASTPRLGGRKVQNLKLVKWPNLPPIEYVGEEVKVTGD